ncbi:Uncharacterized protein M6B38_219675 [Iris pallida]|uniref:Era-type G domain-containing protein n=1 Tax=Iris pallida TaxID=29817 RepID=A0AAX6DY38_IRIPA|nr:Uncharacterized protein M6B38_219675 [Iris pallida]
MALHISPSPPSSSLMRRERVTALLPSSTSSSSTFLSFLIPSSPRHHFRLPPLSLRALSTLNNPIAEDEEEEEYEGFTPQSPPPSSFLSLSEKPDRNMALLDDYELEELESSNFNNPNHRSGYVAVLGMPNVGKSTLSNQMIGQKLSIVTDKPQTTRHRILGICSGPEYQMILYDTPGVIEKKMHKLDSMMMKNVRSAAINADCVLVVVDACKMPRKIDEVFEEGAGVLKDQVPVLLVLNKKDLIKPGEIAKRLEWYEKFTEVDEVIPISAKYGEGVCDVKDWILSKLPHGPAYYPKDITSEHPERFFVAEIVREKYLCSTERKFRMLVRSMLLTTLPGLLLKISFRLKLLLRRTHKRLFL